MNVFLLGAGRPAHGQKPSALKHIALNTRVMDWQIHSFESVAALNDIHYLGGYHVNDVIENYPQLHFTVIPNWQERGLIHTLFAAPFADRPAIITYSDTIFRNTTIKKMQAVEADIVFGIDTKWLERFEQRPADDIRSAETTQIEDLSGNKVTVEFTGLVSFSAKATQHLKNLDEARIGSTLVHLIEYFRGEGFSVKPFDVAGEWAELNSPKDIAKFILGTKADTLARLEPLVKKSYIGKQVSFTSKLWGDDPNSILENLTATFSGARLIVRSSSKGEDNWHSSNAGGFESLLNIDGGDKADISNAIASVINSYGENHNGDDQILIQECLQNVQAAGVVFTCGLESGSPYYRFNFDDKSQSTESVTSGAQGDLRTIIVSRFNSGNLGKVEPALVPVLDAIVELEELLGFDKLDIEFAIGEDNTVHIFQVRPITVDHSGFEIDIDSIETSLSNSVDRFDHSQSSPPFSFGSKTLFANMPDWNPAEIIGIRPKPLAFSVYRHLITNDIWAQQRSEFGYRDVRPYPLILSFSGQPFVDVRASLNSFIPASLPAQTARRIVNAYLGIMADNPQFHDKIEFEVAFTVWTSGFSESARQRLVPYGVTEEDLHLLEQGLKKVTRGALTRLHDDIRPIEQLVERRQAIISCKMPPVNKAVALLDDCKRFGTLAFSHAARAGFVSIIWLQNFVAIGAISEDRRLAFLKSFSTVAGEFESDKRAHASGELSSNEMIENYGHLRPGTYEVTAQAYWEDPQHYLIADSGHCSDTKFEFEFSSAELSSFGKVLTDLGSSITPETLVKYLKEAIQNREWTKFEFTKNLSQALDFCVEAGSDSGFSREDVSFFEYGDLEQLKVNAISVSELNDQVQSRKQQHTITRLIELPSLIRSTEDFFCFERLASQPNFVTVNKIDALVHELDSDKKMDISGKIVLISQADPGYDWLFGHGIAGLVTKFGGANSHMAIRAAEIGLPAAIGVGEKIFEQITAMRRVELDCANQIIREIV